MAIPNIVTNAIHQFRNDAKFILNMAGVYPGDITGELSKEGFLLDLMADVLSDVEWEEHLENYEQNKVTVTYYD